MRKHYLNLTNGLEALATLPEGEPWSFMRLQSTTLERRQWARLFGSDLDHDLLMHLALGWECVLHDRGTLRPRSKTIYLGVPLVRYVLGRRWYGLDPDVVPGGGPRSADPLNIAPYCREVYAEIFERNLNAEKGRVRVRLDYYRRFASCGEVRLVGSSGSTARDGDYAFYRGLASGLASPGPTC